MIMLTLLLLMIIIMIIMSSYCIVSVDLPLRALAVVVIGICSRSCSGTLPVELVAAVVWAVLGNTILYLTILLYNIIVILCYTI